MKMYKYQDRGRVLKIFEELKNQARTKAFLDVLKAHHNETYEHSLRVAQLSIDLALENRLPARIVKIIGKAGLLHDYGKSRIDERVLSKQGPLDPKEASMMKKHPRLGVVELEKYLSPETRKIIISHHEFKVVSYPRVPLERREGIRETTRERRGKYSISYFTQIVAAADMYDALIFPRSYKEGYPVEKVKSIMTEQFIGKPILINQLTKKILNG